MEILNPKSMKWRHHNVIIVFLWSLCKTWPRAETLQADSLW